jgi:hypothetical protein
MALIVAFVALLGITNYYGLVMIRNRLALVEGMDDLGVVVSDKRGAEKNYSSITSPNRLVSTT